MKQRNGSIFNIACAVGCTAIGITWLYRGFSGMGGGFAVLAGVVWLAAAAIWTARTARGVRKEPENTVDETKQK